jgi:hypothetical protein
MELSKEYLSECFDVNFESGELYWKARPVKHFTTEAKCSNWNKRFSGKSADKDTSFPYLRVKLDGKYYYSHRVVVKMYYSEQDIYGCVVDHVNKSKKDNRISNLRICKQTENMKNLKMYNNNSSGISGVSFMQASSLWLVEISNGGREKRIRKYFKTLFDACCARKSLELSHGYLRGHGRTLVF